MARRSIEGLPYPNIGYRADKDMQGQRRFETAEDCRAEDLQRARLLLRAAERYPDSVDGQAAKDLAAKLSPAGEAGDAPQTSACSVYMWLQRYKITGALWKLWDLAPVDAKPMTFTIIPANWDFEAGKLLEADPVRMVASVKTQLYRYAEAKQEGSWLVAFVHGEYEPVAGIYRLHLHGMASPGMIGAIDQLRQLPRFATSSEQADGRVSPVTRRVRIDRKPLVNLPDPITYVCQSFWPARAIVIGEDGNRVRVRQKHRIGEPFHSEVLLWLDAWRLQDLTLMIGAHVGRDGLVITRR